MQLIQHFTTLIASAVVLIAIGSAHCHADFIVSVEVDVSGTGDNLYRYAYTVTNHADSTTPAYYWSLFVSRDANVTAFDNPEEWLEYYLPGDDVIGWECMDQYSIDPSFLIMPSESRTFAFVSSLAPGQTTFRVTGLGYGEDDPMLSGGILGPTQAIVPEPSSACLACIGVLAVAAVRGCTLKEWLLANWPSCRGTVKRCYRAATRLRTS